MTQLSYGAKLAQIRIKAKLSQQEVADMVGVSRSTYTKWESDQCVYKVDVLIKLAEVFRVYPLDLLPVTFSPSHLTEGSPQFGIDLYKELIISKDDHISTLKEQLKTQNPTL
ncbi:MAG: helix-turn-helix domain-containing protein [Spirosomataceae bacterium]